MHQIWYKIATMCLVVFAYQCHPKYSLILAANRDESYQRATQALHQWDTQPLIWAGKDLLQGGTWLGLSERGQFAFLTNYREKRHEISDPVSRGFLVKDALLTHSLESYFQDIKEQADLYNGFNLVAGNFNQLTYYSNRAETIQMLKPGIYAVSNHLLDSSWPKVLAVKKNLACLLQSSEINPDSLFDMMKNSDSYPDDSLPDTGVGLELERFLAPIFIEGSNYGTRSTHVLMIRGQYGDIYERNFSSEHLIGDKERNFKIEIK